MSSFPWDQLKAETLRLVCKDLGAAPAIKRNRESMISFLANIGNPGLTAATTSVKTGSSEAPSVHASATAAKSPSPTEPEESDEDSEEDSDEDSDMNIAESGNTLQRDSKCQCQEGWLSPRLKFILSTTAAVASDLIIDTGEFAEEFGSVGGVYLACHIPVDVHPRGKKAAGLWVEGFSAIFHTIHEIFEGGNIPTVEELDRTLSRLPKDKQKLINAYGKQGAELDSVLEALIAGAEEDWKRGEFEAAHDSKKWRALPRCSEHDLDWDLASDMLVG